MDFINQYYGIILVMLGLTIYTFTHKEISILYAKKVAASFIFLAEKKCEELLLENGESKKLWVVENGYSLLPKFVTVVVNKQIFEFIVQQVFDTAIEYVKNHRVNKNDE